MVTVHTTPVIIVLSHVIVVLGPASATKVQPMSTASALLVMPQAERVRGGAG